MLVTKTGSALEDGAAYRLLSIEATSSPSGCTGQDWLVYRIAQGDNVITGYRQGELKTVSAEVKSIVEALNQRRGSTKGRTGPKPGRPRSEAAAAPPADDLPE